PIRTTRRLDEERGQRTFSLPTPDRNGSRFRHAVAAAGDSVARRAAVTSVPDELNHVTSQVLDALNRVISQTDADNHTSSQDLDANGNPLTQTDPTGSRHPRAVEIDRFG